tara:strand:- start:45 stop:536 length:492 start_codon:yes stop_codon:yes gene_type:complete
MATIEVQPPYPAFAGADGQPLENGYIWIGAVNLNPQVNPITAYWDDAKTIAAVQPIRTLNGYPSYQGTPSRFYVGSDYSIQVLDSKGSVVYTSLNGNTFPGSSGNLYVNETGDGTTTVFAVAFVPSLIYINGVYQNQNTYTLAGGDVTFSEAPPVNSIIEFLV